MNVERVLELFQKARRLAVSHLLPLPPPNGRQSLGHLIPQEQGGSFPALSPAGVLVLWSSSFPRETGGFWFPSCDLSPGAKGTAPLSAQPPGGGRVSCSQWPPCTSVSRQRYPSCSVASLHPHQAPVGPLCFYCLVKTWSAQCCCGGDGSELTGLARWFKLVLTRILCPNVWEPSIRLPVIGL